MELKDVPEPQHNPAFCLDQNGADLDEADFWREGIEDSKDSDNEEEDIFPESLGLWMPFMFGDSGGYKS